MIEKVFDMEVKNIVKNHKTAVPSLVHERINETLDSIIKKDNLDKKTKRIYFSNSRIKKGAIAAALVFIVLFSVAVPSYAKNTSILQSVLSHFGIDGGYNKIINEFGISEESNGVNISINSAIYDGYELLISYTVDSKKALKEKPILNTKALIYKGSNKGIASLFKDKFNASFSSEYGEFMDKDKKAYSGTMVFKVAGDSFDLNNKSNIKEKVIDNHQIDSVRIPDKFTLKLNIDKLGELQGNWDFNLTIESEKAKGNIKEIAVNKDLSNLFPGTKLEKVIITPIRVYLQGTTSNKNIFFDYIIINDKNEIFKKEGGETVQYNKDARYIGSFDSLNKDNKALTIIPYNYEQGKKNNVVPLNLKGETKIPIGSNKQLIITKTEEKNGKTYIYYKSLSPVNDYLPFHLMDAQGVEYMKHEYMNIGGEDVLVYDGLLLNKNLKVVNNTTIFYDNSFTVEFK